VRFVPGKFESRIQSEHWANAFSRIPEILIHFGLLVLIVLSNMSRSGDGLYLKVHCAEYNVFLMGGYLLYLLFFLSSFFSFVPWLKWTLSSPIVRLVHQVLAHSHFGKDPPQRVYIADGGIRENLGLVELLRRGCRRIIVADGGQDFEIKMNNLREAISIATSERICSFYCPQDPTISIPSMLTHFAQSNSSILRVGVRYGWEKGYAKLGDLLVIRMRVLKHDNLNVARLMRCGDITGDPSSCVDGVDDLEHLFPRSQLSGSCCECCHNSPSTWGCCGSFPNHSTANQFLTPLLFANYTRLGYENAEGIEQLLKQVCDEQKATLHPYGDNCVTFVRSEDVSNACSTERSKTV